MTERIWDLIIVGGGTAGMACGISAAEGGAHPLVVEKTGDVGGTLHLSSGQLSAGGTRRQRERGIDDDPERHYVDVMRISRGTADPAIVRRAVQEAPHTLDWLEEIGYEIVPEAPALYYGHEPYSAPRTYWGPEGGQSILKPMRRRWDEEVAAGRITILLEHPARELIVEEGRVAGVVAAGSDGPIELRGRATVLSTGGYGANPKLFAERTPKAERLISACRRSSTGDGLLMAERAGAAFRGGEHYLPTVGGFEPVPGSGSAGEPPHWAILNPNTWPARAIHVNVRGERFLAEDDRSPDRRERALLEQPGHRCWAVFDEASLADGRSFNARLSAEHVRQLADYGAFGWKGGDLATLAGRAGIDATGLQKTVETWNAAVEDGGGDPLGVAQPGPAVATPPFYAFLVNSLVVTTFGGVAVDAELRVVDGDGRPLADLYAAGEILGMSAMNGDAFVGGMSATPAMSFGRQLGRDLAGRAIATRAGGDRLTQMPTSQ